MTPQEYCRQRAARSGSSFHYSFRFLPPERREAITALYAFCREVDDVVDGIEDPATARAKLAWWREEIRRAAEGSAQHPVGRALAEVITRYGLPLDRFEDVLDGMQMDLDRSRYRDHAELRIYCERVAGAVGVLSAHVFGFTDARTLDFAMELGVALQLTNIIRDVGEDARRGRIYLPQTELERHGVSEADVLAGRNGPAFARLMQAQARLAREQQARALALLPAADRRAQRPGLVMAAIYARLLEEIERDGFRVLRHRVALTPLRKLWVAWWTWVRA